LGLDEEDSEEEAAEADSLSSLVLIEEAMQAGFTIDQIRRAEEDLASPTTSPAQVKKRSKFSLSNQIVEVWMENRRKRVDPWKGPLPKPCKLPLWTFEDVLALAMRDCSKPGIKSKPIVHNRDQSSVSHDRSWREPSPLGKKTIHKFCSDLTSLVEYPKLNSNLEKSPQSRRGLNTGWTRPKKQPNTRYTPTTGLVKLFGRTGVRQKTLALLLLGRTSVPTLTQCGRRWRTGVTHRTTRGQASVTGGSTQVGTELVRPVLLGAPPSRGSSQVEAALSSRGQEEGADGLINMIHVVEVLMVRTDSRGSSSDGKR
jgi:hypothetical protein